MSPTARGPPWPQAQARPPKPSPRPPTGRFLPPRQPLPPPEVREATVLSAVGHPPIRAARGTPMRVPCPRHTGPCPGSCRAPPRPRRSRARASTAGTCTSRPPRPYGDTPAQARAAVRTDRNPVPAETAVDRPSRRSPVRTRLPPVPDSRVTKDSAGHQSPGQPKAVGSSGRDLAEGRATPIGEWGPAAPQPRTRGVTAPSGLFGRASPGQPQPGEAPHARHGVPEKPTSCDRYHRSRVTRDLEAPPMRR